MENNVDASRSSTISLRSISKSFGAKSDTLLALDAINLEIKNREFVCIVGASGCGKSTLLNILSGLEKPTFGELYVDEQPSLMFQESALFPWMTAQKNVEIALRFKNVPKKEREAKALYFLEQVHLKEFAQKRPHELSGGMRQRVSLARALAQESKILLMDEPFGALDAITRDLMHDELEKVWLDNDLTILFVTHNVREAVRLGDRVILFSSRPGKVVTEYSIDVERPRRIESVEVGSLASEIISDLRKEVSRHGR